MDPEQRIRLEESIARRQRLLELDRIAEMAMVGFLASPQTLHIDGLRQERSPELIALAAYAQARAMMEQARKERL